jgi:hypothetical protein
MQLIMTNITNPNEKEKNLERILTQMNKLIENKKKQEAVVNKLDKTYVYRKEDLEAERELFANENPNYLSPSDITQYATELTGQIRLDIFKKNIKINYFFSVYKGGDFISERIVDGLNNNKEEYKDKFSLEDDIVRLTIQPEIERSLIEKTRINVVNIFKYHSIKKIKEANLEQKFYDLNPSEKDKHKTVLKVKNLDLEKKINLYEKNIIIVSNELSHDEYVLVRKYISNNSKVTKRKFKGTIKLAVLNSIDDKVEPDYYCHKQKFTYPWDKNSPHYDDFWNGLGHKK